MSGWAKQLFGSAAAVLAATAMNACAKAEPTSATVEISAAEEEELFAAYSIWRRAVICATSWAPGPVAGAEALIARGDRSLRRLEEAGHGKVIARLDARYREIDSRIDWVCGDGSGLTPPETAQHRLENLAAAATRLGHAVNAAVTDR